MVSALGPPSIWQWPLTHSDPVGECSNVMKSYLECIKKVRGVNKDECRLLAKSYLACRMDQWVFP